MPGADIGQISLSTPVEPRQPEVLKSIKIDIPIPLKEFIKVDSAPTKTLKEMVTEKDIVELETEYKNIYDAEKAKPWTTKDKIKILLTSCSIFANPLGVVMLATKSNPFGGSLLLISGVISTAAILIKRLWNKTRADFENEALHTKAEAIFNREVHELISDEKEKAKKISQLESEITQRYQEWAVKEAAAQKAAAPKH